MIQNLSNSYRTVTLQKKINKLKLMNNLFCIEENNKLRIYMPLPLYNTLLHDLHDTSHPGVGNVLREAQQWYYWPLMWRDITNWIKACLHCPAAKVTRQNTVPPVILTPTEKFRDIHLDVVGPLPEVKGMQYLQTAVDQCSRCTMAKPMPNQLASTVAETFIIGWI